MEKDDFLGQRKYALEEAFFKKAEQEQLAKLRAEIGQKSTRDELARATGIADAAVLDSLVRLGVSADTLTALALAPLLRVAWADGAVQPAEREAIVASARDRGVAPDSPAHALLTEWLSHPPEPALDAAWLAYTTALCESMTPEQRTALRQQVVGFARGVAEAAGGFLGVKKISSAEEDALAEIARAFA